MKRVHPTRMTAPVPKAGYSVAQASFSVGLFPTLRRGNTQDSGPCDLLAGPLCFCLRRWYLMRSLLRSLLWVGTPQPLTYLRVDPNTGYSKMCLRLRQSTREMG